MSMIKSSEKYNSNFITEKLQNRESDVIYKIIYRRSARKVRRILYRRNKTII